MGQSCEISLFQDDEDYWELCLLFCEAMEGCVAIQHEIIHSPFEFRCVAYSALEGTTGLICPEGPVTHNPASEEYNGSHEYLGGTFFV